MRISTLKKRVEFERVRGGGRCSTAAFLLEGKKRVDLQHVGQPRFGFTITRKLGGAVQRNSIRRRLRAALSLLAGEHADPAFDYVIVARAPALDRNFSELQADLVTAFRTVQRTAAQGGHHKRGKRNSTQK